MPMKDNEGYVKRFARYIKRTMLSADKSKITEFRGGGREKKNRANERIK